MFMPLRDTWYAVTGWKSSVDSFRPLMSSFSRRSSIAALPSCVTFIHTRRDAPSMLIKVDCGA